MYEEHPTQSAQNLLAAIVESSDDAIISKTLQGIITSWNGGAERIFGYSKEEAIGQHITLIIPSERKTEEKLIINQISKGERVDHFETLRVTKSGTLIPLSITVSPVRNEEGKIIGASKVAREITERKKTEDILTNEARRKDEFIAVLAHELRNPLAPVKSALNILQLKQERSKTDAWALSIIDRQLTQMTRLIDDLLDIARITGDKLEIRKEEITLQNVFNLALETSRPNINDNGHHLIVSLPEEPVFICADLVRIAQVISNLLNNAAKYTDNGGHIWLIGTLNAGEVEIIVRDTGRGIVPDKISEIFDLFTQVNEERKVYKGGLGIGLTLVKRLTEMHGGSVEVESEGSGYGSTFTVRLPALPIKTIAESTIAVNQNTELSLLRFLVVDDNKDAADSLALLIRSYGCLVKTAYEGVTALQIASQYEPQVILLDIGMPKLDGYQVAKAVRKQSWSKNTLIIATTGWGQDSDRQQSKEAGFNHHLVKPIDVAEVTNLVAQHTA